MCTPFISSLITKLDVLRNRSSVDRIFLVIFLLILTIIFPVPSPPSKSQSRGLSMVISGGAVQSSQ